MQLFVIIFGAILVNNFVLTRFLGICPFLGVSKSVETSAGMGLAVTFVMTLASAAAYAAYRFILVPLDLEFLYNIAFILIIASLVQFIELYMKKFTPGLHRALGVYLPLITTNCAVLGVTVLNRDLGYGFVASVVNGFAAAIGFMLAIVLLAGIRERADGNDILPHFAGFPITMITAGLMSLAFMGFSNMIRA